VHENGRARAIREIIFQQEAAEFIVSGISMAPFLMPGRKVRLIPWSGAMPLRPGECYAYLAENKICLHRLVDSGSQSALFWADNLPEPERVPYISIIAKLDRKSRLEILYIYINRFFLFVARIIPCVLPVRMLLFRILGMKGVCQYEKKI